MKSSQRQFLNTIDGIAGTWAQRSGGEVTSDATKVRDGGATRAEVIASPPEIGDITLTRPYDAERDQPLLDRLIKMVGEWRTTVTVQPLAGNMSAVRGTKPRVYPDALLIGVREPESDADSGDAADLELTFAAGDIA